MGNYNFLKKIFVMLPNNSARKRTSPTYHSSVFNSGSYQYSVKDQGFKTSSPSERNGPQPQNQGFNAETSYQRTYRREGYETHSPTRRMPLGNTKIGKDY